MGRITRTNFGCTVTVDIPNASVLTLPTAGITLVSAIAGAVIFPIAALARLSWVADYTNIDAAAQFKISCGDLELTHLNETVAGSTVSDLLAAGGTFSVAFGGLLTPVSGNQTIPIAGLDDVAVGVGQPLTVFINNQASGNLTGGDPGNVLQLTTFYCVVPVS